MVSRPRPTRFPETLLLRLPQDLMTALTDGAKAREMTRSDFARECLMVGFNVIDKDSRK